MRISGPSTYYMLSSRVEPEQEGEEEEEEEEF